MSVLPNLPANPTLMDRIEALEALVVGYEQRIATLEVAIGEHQSGAVERQRQIDRIEARERKTRWAARFGRTP